MAKLKGIQLFFENCEYCFIPVEHIESMSINNISKEISYDKKGDLQEYDTCSISFLEISNKFLNKAHSRFTKKCINKKIKLIDRLKEQDVVEICLIYVNNKNKGYFLPWNDVNDDYTNKYQLFTIKENTSFLSVSEDIDENSEG